LEATAAAASAGVHLRIFLESNVISEMFVAVVDVFFFDCVHGEIFTSCCHADKLQFLHGVSVFWIIHDLVEDFSDFGSVENWLLESDHIINLF